jgi:hypothetical protein
LMFAPKFIPYEEWTDANSVPWNTGSCSIRTPPRLA